MGVVTSGKEKLRAAERLVGGLLNWNFFRPDYLIYPDME